MKDFFVLVQSLFYLKVYNCADYCCNIGTIVSDVRRHFESKKCCYEICGGAHLIKSVSRVKRHEFVSYTLTIIPH